MPSILLRRNKEGVDYDLSARTATGNLGEAGPMTGCVEPQSVEGWVTDLTFTKALWHLCIFFFKKCLHVCCMGASVSFYFLSVHLQRWGSPRFIKKKLMIINSITFIKCHGKFSRSCNEDCYD